MAFVVCCFILFLFIYQTLPPQTEYNTSSAFLSTAGFNPDFSFSHISYHTNVKDLSLSNYLLIAGFISFSRLLFALCEIQTALPRILNWSSSVHYITTAWLCKQELKTNSINLSFQLKDHFWFSYGQNIF